MSNYIDNTINGKCSMCATCCTSILPLSSEEIRTIEKYIKKNNIEIINRNNILTNEFVDICPFLNKESKCNIYSIRPEVCRNFLCSEMEKHDGENINHKEKKFINMLLVFAPESFCPEPPDIEHINNYYQMAKSQLYKKRRK